MVLYFITFYGHLFPAKLLNGLKMRNFIVVFVGLVIGLANPAHAVPDCAQIADPQLSFECTKQMRDKNLKEPAGKEVKLDLMPALEINDWVKVGSINDGEEDFYYSPKSAKFHVIPDSQAPTGSSRVVILNTLVDRRKPKEYDGKTYSSVITTAMYHCNFPNLKELRFETRSKNMGKGILQSAKEYPISQAWQKLMEGDEVILEFVRDFCPASGKSVPTGPLQILFSCYHQTPSVAKTMVEGIIKQILHDTSRLESVLRMHRGSCEMVSGKVTNKDYLQKAELIGAGSGRGFYVIPDKNDLAFGVVGD